MKAAYLKKVDKAIKKAGTRNAKDVIECAGLVYIDPGSTVDGFIALRKGIVFYGVSETLKGNKHSFGIYHEGGHYWCRHLDLPGFIDKEGAHRDEIGTFSLRHKIISSTETDANICGAHGLIETEPFLDMLGYDNADVTAYRNSLESFEKAVRDYEYHISIVQNNGSPESRIKRMMAYRSDLGRMYDELEEQAQDIYNSGCILSKYEIAREYGVPEYIIDLKIEALSYFNYSVATVELPSFSKVFSDWKC